MVETAENDEYIKKIGQRIYTPLAKNISLRVTPEQYNIIQNGGDRQDRQAFIRLAIDIFYLISLSKNRHIILESLGFHNNLTFDPDLFQIKFNETINTGEPRAKAPDAQNVVNGFILLYRLFEKVAAAVNGGESIDKENFFTSYAPADKDINIIIKAYEEITNGVFSTK